MLKNKEIRRQASRMALSSGALMKLCLGVCVCVASVMIPLLVPGVLAELLLSGEDMIDYFVSEVLLAVEVLLFAALTIPVIGGFVGLVYKLYRNEDTHLAQIFLPFTSAKIYFRVIFAGIPMLLRWVAIIAFSLIVSSALLRFTVTEVWLIDLAVRVGAVVVPIILAALFAFLSSDMFFVPYFICNGCQLSEAFGRSRATMRGRKLKLVGYTFGFAGILALSLLTVGTLFVIYTIPMMVFAYFIYAEQTVLDEYNNF